VLAYLVLWAILPTSAGPAAGSTAIERSAERIARSIGATPAWVGAAILILGVLLVVVQILEWDSGVFWGIALIVGGVLLFRQPEWRPAPEARAASDAISPPAPPAAPGGEAAHAAAPPLPSPAVPYRYRRPARRPGSRLGWMTLGAVLIALGAAALLDLQAVLDVSAGQYPALAVAVIGLGLIAGAWYGRARWLVLPGLLLLPVVLVASLIHVPFIGGFGDRYYNPSAVEAVQPEYHIIAGQMLIDLSAVTPGAEPVTVRATAVAGRILVLVSRGTPVDVRARVGGGEVNLFGQTFDGVDVDVRRTFGRAPVPSATSALRLDLETSLGVVEVRADEASSS
jgi:hypothetical protein